MSLIVDCLAAGASSCIPAIAPTAELRRRLLVDNPMRLYRAD